MRIVLLAGLLLLAACQRAPDAAKPPAGSPKPSGEIATAAPAADVDGWHMDASGYAKMGTTAPAFALKTLDGKEISQAALRDHWTILAFWGLWSDDSKADASYIHALNSAVDQDPNLDLLSIHIPETGAASPSPTDPKTIRDWFAHNGGSPWPTAVDIDGKVSAAFRVSEAPFYLLIGPDLTIEGYRGALSKTPDDGIKPLIRGVAEIKKQIADPS